MIKNIPQNSSIRYHVDIECSDTNVTTEALWFCLSNLYKPMKLPINIPDSAILASACILQMNKLALIVIERLRSSMSISTIPNILSLLSRTNQQNIYYPIISQLNDQVISYLCTVAPKLLLEYGGVECSQYKNILINDLSYELFKALIESPDLPISSPMHRFQYAKSIVELRNSRIRNLLKKHVNERNGLNARELKEESVVLAFGGDYETPGSLKVVQLGSSGSKKKKRAIVKYS